LVWRARPGLIAVALVSLALGVGANSVMFSLVDGMFLRPLPVRDPGELVWRQWRAADGQSSVSCGKPPPPRAAVREHFRQYVRDGLYHDQVRAALLATIAAESDRLVNRSTQVMGPLSRAGRSKPGSQDVTARSIGRGTRAEPDAGIHARSNPARAYRADAADRLTRAPC